MLWIAWQYIRNPLDSIDLPTDELSLLQDSVFYDGIIPAPRQYSKMILNSPDLQDINFILSLPDTSFVDPLPVLIILGGLEIGIETLKFIPEPGNNAIVIYQYPYHPRYWYYGTAIEEIPVIRESVLRVPAQVLAMKQWISRQSWADSSRINLAGYSFGALFTPAVTHLAQIRGEEPEYTVITYGGADLYRLLVHNMTNVDQPWRSIVSWLAITAIRGIEPAYHAPYMDSEILLVNGTQDTQIPEVCWRELHALVPHPKTIMKLNEGHMHPRKPELTLKLVRLTRDWLLERGAINP